LEEIGSLFGDDHIANRWYGTSEEEKQRVAQEALDETAEGADAAEGGLVKSEAVRKDEV
jgi:hypothetical protein